MSAGRGATARRARNRQEMRAAIVDATRRLVSEHGAPALTMRAVGQAIGYSAAALYEYFPAKEGLYAALYFDERDGLSARMRDDLAALPPDTTTRDRLLALGRSYRAFAHQQPELFRLAFGEAMTDNTAPPPPAGLADDDCDDAKDAFGLLVEVATTGIERGDFTPMPPLVLAITAWSLVHGFVILELNGHLTDHGPPTLRAEAVGSAALSSDELFGLITRLFTESVAHH